MCAKPRLHCMPSSQQHLVSEHVVGRVSLLNALPQKFAQKDDREQKHNRERQRSSR